MSANRYSEQERAVRGRETVDVYVRLAIAAGLISLGLGVGYALRHVLVQAPELAWACGGASKPWWCAARQALITSFRWQGLGLIAVLCGALALLRRAPGAAGSRGWAGVAIAVGAAGLLLYAPELSAAGLLLGALRVLRS